MTLRERPFIGGRIDETLSEFGYQSGFGNTHSTEAETGALPIGRNAPQRPPLGLYAEQISGSAFTAPRETNRRSWLYRILPSVRHGVGFERVAHDGLRTAPCRESDLPAAQLRWKPLPIPTAAPVDFLDGLKTLATCGDAGTQVGMASHVFAANASMDRKYLQNADGEMLIVPQTNRLSLFTELGVLVIGPGEIAVVPRGVRFRVDLPDGPVRGYVCENYGAPLTLPGRGPIGANGLANERDFLYPAAAYEDGRGACEMYLKTRGRLFATRLPHSPLDVVAWHGNHAPYKYDLRRFCPIGAALYDHLDPSIYTVLTSPSDTAGVANLDFVIFPERWVVMEDTFRPPWYHQNVMSEFMGLVYGVYDARPGGFVPGAASLHNAMVPHGPDAEAFGHASSKVLSPEKLEGTLAFMFETRYVMEPTTHASDPALLDTEYPRTWDGRERHFHAR